MPFISFCFTTYKRPDILIETVKSILLQSFSDFEIIISDNDEEQSGRKITEVLKDPRIKYFPNETNLGMKKSFNKSLERSSGEYIVMIADDDPVYPGMLETLVNLYKQYPGYGMYMGGCDWFCADRDVAKLYKLNVGTNSCLSNQHNLDEVQVFSTADFIKSLFTFDIFSHFLWSTCIVKRKILIGMGGIPDYGTPFLGDYAYMSIACTDNGCVIINRSLGRQTIHKENFGRNQNEQLPIVAEHFPKYLKEKLSYLKEWQTIQPAIMRFLGLWLTGHMAFLYHYYKTNKLDNSSLINVEKEVLRSQAANKFKVKYFLKKKMPWVHDNIVNLKRMTRTKRKKNNEKV